MLCFLKSCNTLKLLILSLIRNERREIVIKEERADPCDRTAYDNKPIEGEIIFHNYKHICSLA